MILIVSTSTQKHWLNSWTGNFFFFFPFLFSGRLFEEHSSFSFALGHFYSFQISSVSSRLKTFCLCRIACLILSLYSPKFYPEAHIIYSSMLIQQDFPQPCQKANSGQMEFLCGLLSESCLPASSPAKELSGHPCALACSLADILFSLTGRQPKEQSANTPVSIFNRAQIFKDFLSTLRAT